MKNEVPAITHKSKVSIYNNINVDKIIKNKREEWGKLLI